jgi:flavin reductase (DIM6/NTAB) family NADH-FMN oxidoreductase RutF
VSRLDTPVFVVTAVGRDGERAGCLIGFATQCSVKPPRFLACISKQNRTFDVVGKSETVCVHFLGQGQRWLADLFGGETGDEVDKFELADWTAGPGGVPVLADVVGWFAGRVLERMDLGDHVGLLLDPIAAQDHGGRPDLGFQSVKDIDPGHPV